MSSGHTSHCYSLFGLRLRSEIALPDLPQIPADSAFDVTLREAPIASGERRPGLHALDKGVLLVIESVARYFITADEIAVERAAGAPTQNVRLYLLGSAMGCLLHMRGVFALHANAVEFSGTAAAFMGASGDGKSTLAAWFADKGYRVLADDVCAVRFNVEGEPTVSPGLRRLRLWKDAIEARGLVTSKFRKSYAGIDEFEKYDVPLAPEMQTTHGCLLRAIYVLGRSDQPSITGVQGRDALELLFNHTYRGQYLDRVGSARQHWTSCVRLVAAVPVFRFERRWDLGAMAEDCGLVSRHFSALS